MSEIYIDFDRTIYNTDKLYSDIVELIKSNGISEEEFYLYQDEYLKKNNLFNIFDLIIWIGKSKKINVDLILEKVDLIINEGEKYIFDDVKEFLTILKNKHIKVNILTYGDYKFQMTKLKPLPILDSINSIIITKSYKYETDLNYKKSIFIDDNPRDLNGLYLKNAKKVIRLNRKQTKYANIKLDKDIKTYSNLLDVLNEL